MTHGSFRIFNTTGARAQGRRRRIWLGRDEHGEASDERVGLDFNLTTPGSLCMVSSGAKHISIHIRMYQQIYICTWIKSSARVCACQS